MKVLSVVYWSVASPRTYALRARLLRMDSKICVNLRGPDRLVYPSFRRKPESSLFDRSLDPGFRRGGDEETSTSGMPLLPGF